MPKRRPTRTPSVHPKVVENRVRDHAKRWHLELRRTREQYGPIARSYGLWDADGEDWACAGPLGYGKTLEEIESYLAALQTAPARAGQD